MPSLRNLETLRRQSEHAWAGIGGFDRLGLHFSGALERQHGSILVENSLPLRDIIDVEQLVNRHELRKEGIEPGAVRVILGPRSFSIPELHLLVLGEKDLDRMRTEDFYVIIAHELTHFQQMLSGNVTVERATKYLKDHRLHADRPHEIEAFFWEAQQATKFGWGREEYADFLVRLFGKERIQHEPVMAEELVARSAAGLPVLQRRPVRVRSYRRRR